MAQVNALLPDLAYVETTIANGATESAAVKLLQNKALVGVLLGAEYDGTALTFQGSVDGTNYFPIHAAGGSAVSATVAASRFVVLDPASFQGVTHLKLVAGTSQTGATTLKLAFR